MSTAVPASTRKDQSAGRLYCASAVHVFRFFIRPLTGMTKWYNHPNGVWLCFRMLAVIPEVMMKLCWGIFRVLEYPEYHVTSYLRIVRTVNSIEMALATQTFASDSGSARSLSEIRTSLYSKMTTRILRETLPCSIRFGHLLLLTI